MRRRTARLVVAALVAAVFAGGASGGVAGPVKKRSLDVPMPVRGPADVQADVQVSLTWDVDSDLDLAVVEPSGERIYFGNPTSRTGGALDLDSNAACVIDGTRVENIRWPPSEAPNGQYTVAVNEFDSCGTSKSNYTVRIVNGASVQTFRGTIDGERTIEIATFHRRAGDPSRTVEQTQDECLNDAGAHRLPNNPAWDPMVGPCVGADEADAVSVGNLAEACRECWLLHGDGSAQMLGSSLTGTAELLDCMRSWEGGITTLAGVGFVVATIGGFGVPALGFGAFYVTMTLARGSGISPVQTLANGLARTFGVLDFENFEPSNLRGSRATVDAGAYTLKVQSTSPDALAFDFADNGDLEFHFGRSEPAAFVWTLMEGDTPIGSLVVPYTPRAAPVPALPVFGFVALGAGLAAAGLVRLRRNVRR